MRSSYLHALTSGAEHRPLAEVVIEGSPYVAMSLYATQLERYLERFDRSQVLVITAESLRERRAATVTQVLEFLGVQSERSSLTLGRELHKTAEKRVPRATARWVGGVMVRAEPWLGRGRSSGAGPKAAQLPRLLSRPLRPRDGEIGGEVRQRMLEWVRSDVERIAPYVGPDFDGWGMLPRTATDDIPESGHPDGSRPKDDGQLDDGPSR
jgi:hypothetical protein